MNMNCYNGVKAIGYIINFKIFTFDSGTKKANIAIKDELTNNVIYVDMFGSDKLKYDGKEITLNGLKSIFLDKDNNPRHVLVKVSGKVADNKYTNKSGQEVVNSTPLIFSINPYNNPEDQCIIFNFTGIVDNFKETKGGEELKIRLGIVKTNRDSEPDGIEYNTLIATGEIKDKLEEEDLEKYSLIRVAGDILNVVPTDKYGVTGGARIKEMRIKRVVKVTSSDDVDDFEDVYMQLRKGKEPIVKAKDEDNEVADKKESKEKLNVIDDDDLDF